MKKLILAVAMLFTSIVGFACSTPTGYGITVLNKPCAGDSLSFLIYGTTVEAFVLSGTFTFPDPIFPVGDTTYLKVLPANSIDTGSWTLDVFDDCYNIVATISARVEIKSPFSVTQGTIEAGPNACAGSAMNVISITPGASNFGGPVGYAWLVYESPSYNHKPAFDGMSAITYYADSFAYGQRIFRRVTFELGCPFDTSAAQFASDTAVAYYLGTKPVISGAVDSVYQPSSLADFRYHLLKDGIPYRDSMGTGGPIKYLGLPDGTYTVLSENIGTGCGLLLSGSVTFGTPLPIELVSFEANAKNEVVELVWSTATETNNDKFELLRFNGENFEVFATVQGAGNSTEIRNYVFTDDKPLIGINYYRLRQVDFDGKSTSSDIISIEVVSSDPAWQMEGGILSAKGKIFIRDLSGKVIVSGKDEVFYDLPPGTYVITVNDIGRMVYVTK